MVKNTAWAELEVAEESTKMNSPIECGFSGLRWCYPEQILTFAI